MAQFDVHRNLDARTRDDVPLLLNIQSDLLDSLATRVVVPLVRASVAGRAARTLNPAFRIDGMDLVMSTPELAGVPKRALGPVVSNETSRRGEILAALDLLLTGI